VGAVSDKRRFRGQSPERSTTLADPSRVLRVARASLADLDDASAALGEALVAAGLPRRAWRTEQATLRSLDAALPAITLGAFLARLDAFAVRGGPAWLRGTHADLEVFYQEVGALQAVVRPLLGAVRRLQRTPNEEGRQGWRRQRPSNPLRGALRHPRVEAPLATIAEILSGFEARAPLMMAVQAVQPRRPVSRAPDLSDLATGPFPADTGLPDDAPRTQRGAVASPAASPRAKASALAAKLFLARWAVAPWLVGLGGPPGFRQRLAAWRRWLRGWRLAASGGLALILAVTVVGSALVLAHRPPAASPVTARSSASSPAASLTALAGSSTATAPATGVPTPAPAPSATAAPPPKLALSCTLQGTTATLTLKNVGTSPFTWQVQPPPTLTVAPTRGALEAGQSAVLQVSAKNKKTATGTIRVVASHESQSTEGRVSCS
jgi:hypothetical protein